MRRGRSWNWLRGCGRGLLVSGLTHSGGIDRPTQLTPPDHEETENIGGGVAIGIALAVVFVLACLGSVQMVNYCRVKNATVGVEGKGATKTPDASEFKTEEDEDEETGPVLPALSPTKPAKPPLGATGPAGGGDMLAGDPIPIMVRRTDASHKASTVAEARGMLGP